MIILIATGVALIALVVLLLVPSSEANTAMVTELAGRLEGFLAFGFPATIHTLMADRVEKVRQESLRPPPRKREGDEEIPPNPFNE